MPLDGLVRIGRILRIVLEAARLPDRVMSGLLERLPLVPVGMHVRMARPTTGGGNAVGIGHMILLRNADPTYATGGTPVAHRPQFRERG
jgi:hypothetical protein